MSTQSEIGSTELLKIAKEKTGWLSVLNERISERCSSILVKESRQALKSKQFVWTYFLLLACVGLWALIGIAAASTGTRGVAGAGRELLSGFLVILGFPLGLIIPFSAYRSLAREFEDGTIQLISITTLKPWQIIAGKFGSAILQMLVYLSVLAPCILFTYLLRGVSLPQILFCLAICIGASICLTIFGLFLAGVVRSRALGVGVSVLFVLLLGWLYFGWWVMVFEMLEGSFFVGISDPEATTVIYCFVAFFGSLAVLMLVAAASQISFSANNRSTGLRLVMIVQQTLFFAAAVAIIQMVPFEADLYIILMFCAAHYWLIMGFMMIGESPQMSRRVQRSLPTSFLSKSVFSLLMPGPGRGFLFAASMIVTCAMVMGLMILFQGQLIMNPEDSSGWIRSGMVAWRTPGLLRVGFAIVACCVYPILYLAVTWLILNFLLHRKKRVLAGGTGPLIGLATGTCVVALPMIFALIWHFSTVGRASQNQYSLSQVFNWYWTVDVICTPRSSLLFATWLLFWAAVAFVIVLVAVVIAARELRYRPISVPERVLIDEKKPGTVLPHGESIEEIFGKLES